MTLETYSWLHSRRRTRRVPVRVPLTFRLDGREFAGYTGDISRDGLSVTTAAAPPVSTMIQVDLTVHTPQGGRRPVSLMAWVRWKRDNPILAPPSEQFGVQILAFRDATHAARHDAFVESMLQTVIVMEVTG